MSLKAHFKCQDFNRVTSTTEECGRNCSTSKDSHPVLTLIALEVKTLGDSMRKKKKKTSSPDQFVISLRCLFCTGFLPFSVTTAVSEPTLTECSRSPPLFSLHIHSLMSSLPTQLQRF